MSKSAYIRIENITPNGDTVRFDLSMDLGGVAFRYKHMIAIFDSVLKRLDIDPRAITAYREVYDMTEVAIDKTAIREAMGELGED